MINLIVWSKDRPCQLHLLLQSIATNMSDWFDIMVLYSYSNEEYKQGYSKLKEEFGIPRPGLKFMEEENFRADTLHMLDRCTCDRVAFSTDDTVVYRNPGPPNDVMMPVFDSECFSLRLGLNTIVQDPHAGTHQPHLSRYVTIGNTIYWNRSLYHPLTNYGYAFALDMHIYRAQILRELIPTFPWQNTNQLESGLFQHRDRIIYLASYQQSVAVNVPMNSLSQVTRAGEQYPYSQELLNQAFLDGERISLKSISEANIVGCHQEIPLEFV